MILLPPAAPAVAAPPPPARPSSVCTARSFAAATLLLAGCAHPPPPPTTWDWHIAADADETIFANASTLLDGFDPRRPGERVAAGDQVLFGVRLLDGPVDGGERRDWFVRFTAIEDEPIPAEPGHGPTTIAQWFACGPIERVAAPGRYVREAVDLRGVRLRVEVFDGELQPLADDEVAIMGFLFEGAVAGCAEAATVVPPPPGALSAAYRARAAIHEVMRVVRKTPSLLAILREIAQLPPLWTLFRGVRVISPASLEHAIPVADPGGGTGYEFPLRVVINGTPALLCTVTAVAPTSPLRVCGGFTRLVASDPEDPERRVVLTLLAARRSAPLPATAVTPAR